MPFIAHLYRRADVHFPMVYFGTAWVCVGLAFLLKRQARINFGLMIVAALYAVLILFIHLGMTKVSLAEKVVIYSIALQPLVFVAMVPMILREADYRKMISLMMVVMTIAALFGLTAYFFQIEQMFGLPLFGNGFSREGFTRYGVFLNRNYEASFFQVIAPLSLYLYGNANKFRNLWIATFFIACVHIWLTYSRGAQLGFAISLTPLMTFIWLKKKPALFALLFAFMALVVASLKVDKFASYKYVQNLTAMRDRDLYWQDAVTYLHEQGHWLWGTGYRGYWPLGYMPHNLVITQVLYYGILAPILWVAMLWLSLRPYFKWTLLRDPFQEPRVFIASAILGLVVSDMFADHLSMGLYFTSAMYWFLMGAAVAKKSPAES